MEDRRRQHGAGVAFLDAGDEVVEVADAARGDDGDRHSVGDGAGQRDVEAELGAVAIHRGQQDFAGAERRHFARVVDARRCRSAGARHG